MKKCIMLFFLITCTVSVYSQDTSIVQLRNKIEQLENRVTNLEKIIADKNNSIDKASNTISADKQIWRNLRNGMRQADVRKLLGEPLTVENTGYTFWFYTKNPGNSYVMFDTDDRVCGWSEPD